MLELTRDIINLLKEGRFSELKNFIIIGESASHKTIVTKALLNFAKSFTTVAYLNLPVLQEMVLGIDFFEQRRILNLIKEVGLLVLDDLGSETVSDYFRDSWIYKIISSRLTTKLPTLIVTNFSLEQLEVVEAGAKPTAFTRLKSKQLIKRIRNSYGIITTSQTSLEEAASLKL